MEASKCNELNLLAIQRLVGIVKTADGKFFLAGDQRGLHRSGGTNNSSTGTAFSDLQGYAINLMSRSDHDTYEIDSAVIAGLTIAV